MKVIIAGGRDFTDHELLQKRVDDYLWIQIGDNDVEIVSGGQASTDKETGEKYGADYFGEEYAKNNSFPLKVFPADWNKYGKSAGYKRNTEMAEYADALIAFWDGKSKGTKMMIDIATKKGLKVEVFKY